MAGKRRSRPVTDEQIVALYQENHSAYVTARALGIGSTTVERVLTKHQVPRPGLAKWREKATKFRGQEIEIKEAYESGLTLAQLRGRFGEASDYALKHAIRRAGGVLRDNPAPLTKAGEVEKIRSLHQSGMSQMAISIAIGRSQSFVGRTMRRNGIKAHRPHGKTHSMWRGGRYKDASGYIRAWVAADDPMACMALSTGHVLEHRLVMARKLGRPLLISETVHHLDGDRANNHPDNLQLRQGKHGKGTVMCCRDCGSFNVAATSIGEN